jgi:hypothetical protein
MLACENSVTTGNVDLCFSHAVAHRHEIMPSTDRRTLIELSFFANALDCIDGSKKMYLESHSVKLAPAIQGWRFIEHKSKK